MYMFTCVSVSTVTEKRTPETLLVNSAGKNVAVYGLRQKDLKAQEKSRI